MASDVAARAVRSGGRCIAHGGGSRCQVNGCDKGVQSRGRCSAHGGGRRCQVEGCTKGVQSRGRCSAHGGGRRCQVEGCDKGAQSRGRCMAHGGGRRCQVNGCDKGALSGERCRAHGGGRRCQMNGCDKGARSGGRCSAHGGGRRCQVEGCKKGVQSRGRCSAHGGGRRCQVEGCKKGVQSCGRCRAHQVQRLPTPKHHQPILVSFDDKGHKPLVLKLSADDRGTAWRHLKLPADGRGTATTSNTIITVDRTLTDSTKTFTTDNPQPKVNDPIIVINKDEIDKIGKKFSFTELVQLVEKFRKTKGGKLPKLLEIRRGAVRSKKEGSNVFLSGSGTGSIQNVAKYQGCTKMSVLLWNLLRQFHQVDGPRLCGDKTWGYWLEHITKCVEPIPYEVKRGSVIWRKFNHVQI